MHDKYVAGIINPDNKHYKLLYIYTSPNPFYPTSL